MRRDNRGYTLIEILVVVAIMVVLVGVLSLSINTVFSARAKRCAYEIDSYIDMCRISSISRAGNVYITLEMDSEGRVVGSYYEGTTGTLKSTEILSGGSVDVVYTVGVVDTTLSGTDPLTLAFSRESGAFKPVSGTDYCTEIRVTSGRTYVITLVPSTGSHYID